MTGSLPAVPLAALATAVPPHRLRQDEAAETAAELFAGRMAAFERLRGVFAGSGIEQRTIAMPLEWYREPRGWPERTEAFLTVATGLFETAARRALDQAGREAGEIDCVVTVTSTGIATPGLEARALDRLGLRHDVERVPVFGLGCAGGATGLALAARLARARPGCLVLLVVVELCSLSFRLDRLTKANIVATALFGDGAAAAVLGGRPGDGAGNATGLAVADGREHTWPDTLSIMGWSVDPDGFGVIFDRDIPPFAERHLARALDGMLAAQGLRRDAIARMAFHPGGRKVIEAIEGALALPPGHLSAERAVLRDQGNMSAPTVLFVLERLLRDALPDSLALTALGPGFTASSVTLRRAA